MIAGLSSKWPVDWDQNLKVRLNPQANVAVPINGFPTWPPFNDNMLFGGRIPTPLSPAMCAAMGEGLLSETGWNVFQTTSTYQKSGDDTAQKNDLWYNGWFPLFVEWEVEYYHIPFENWEFVPQVSQARMGYSLKQGANPADPSIQGDYRILKGHCPILPQAGSSLATRLQQVFSKINPADISLSTADKAALLDDAKALEFSSAPMVGMTDQLLSQMSGMHVNPLRWDPQYGLVPTDDALKLGAEIGFTGKADLLLMAGTWFRLLAGSMGIALISYLRKHRSCDWRVAEVDSF